MTKIIWGKMIGEIFGMQEQEVMAAKYGQNHEMGKLETEVLIKLVNTGHIIREAV